jgi:hypothetical protein
MSTKLERVYLYGVPFHDVSTSNSAVNIIFEIFWIFAWDEYRAQSYTIATSHQTFFNEIQSQSVKYSTSHKL